MTENLYSIITYLLGFRNDVFKLLPMRESSDCGVDNHIEEYLDGLISNAKGALIIFPELKKEKKFISVANDLCFLSDHTSTFQKWRKTILSSTRNIEDLKEKYSKERLVSVDE